MRIALCLTLLLTPATRADWPRFRGPNGLGTSADAGVPVSFDEKAGVLWKVPLAGDGNSSPVVSGGRVFLQTSEGNSGARKLVALDAKTGKQLWEYAAPGGPSKVHAKSSTASSTPATDGKGVAVVFWDGSDISLTVCEVTGAHRWTRPLGPFASQHGAGISPIILGDRVVIANDQDGSSKLQAFDLRTGDTLWEAPRPADKACYATPAVWTRPDGKEVLLVASSPCVTAYDPADGKVVWNWAWQSGGGREALRVVASPLVVGGLVVVTSGNGGGNRNATALKLEGTGERGPEAVAWRATRLVPYVPTMLASGECLFGVDDKGVASCLVAETGKELWSERLPGGYTASPVMAGRVLFAVSEDGIVSAVKAGVEFELLGTSRLRERVYATPAVDGGRMYIRGAKHLWCVGR